ncbi:MAG TPA: Ig-like domain-containing protein [Candidatus Dormibacteraeota bacterium]
MPPRAALVVLVTFAAAALLTACGSPPQVLDISPQRGAVDVRSGEMIRVRFDRPMNHASVTQHFHLEPGVQGALRWNGNSEMVFEHVPFNASSQYRVVLEPGYRDAHGTTNPLRHSWTFRTEAPPSLASSSPAPGDRDVDPAAYITLTFSREVDPGSLASAIGLSPSAPFAIHQDPADARRVILAPQSLLEPRTGYSVTVSRDARDVDGNRLGAGAAVSFTTGAFRPLRHWISFIAAPSPESGGTGVWIVNENKVARRLIDGPVSAFSWSADSSRLLLRSPAGTWTDQPLDGTPAVLAFQAEWADFLAPGRGYAFLDHGQLQLMRPDGGVIQVATGVTEATVAPGGGRLAFATREPSGSGATTEIDGYDTELRTRYRLQVEPEPVDGLAWSPDGQSLAYRLDTSETTRRQVRVRSLRDGTAVTVVTGEVSAPVWQADRQHVFFTAVVQGPGGPVTRAFRSSVSPSSTPGTLSASSGMPAGQDVRVGSLSPSPDGHQVAFAPDGDGRAGVWEMNADGTGLTQLTDPDPGRFPYSVMGVTWTPG